MQTALKVTPEELKNAAGSFEDTGRSVNTTTQAMLTLINEINGVVWSGEAASAYKTKFAGLSDDMNKLYSMINEHVSDLRQIADEYIKAEDANRELANTLASDVIS